jgi:hypothetical protein
MATSAKTCSITTTRQATKANARLHGVDRHRSPSAQQRDSIAASAYSISRILGNTSLRLGKVCSSSDLKS